jgi:hypothetical protein
VLQARLAAHNVEPVSRFMGEAIWEYGERRRGTGAARPPDRVNPGRIAVFPEIEAVLDQDPHGPEGRALGRRWQALLDRETGGDAELGESMMALLAGRHQWPRGMQRYMASLYAMEWDRWDRVVTFLEEARQDSSQEARP